MSELSSGSASLLDALPEYPPPDVAAPLIVWEYAQALRERLRRYEKALIRCVVASGADTSGGIPKSPRLDEWAEREVEWLRKDYDEACVVLYEKQRELAVAYGIGRSDEETEWFSALDKAKAEKARLLAAIAEERRWATGTAEHNDARSALYELARVLL